jgi:selenocysteine lyase/cysteine desulfurase
MSLPQSAGAPALPGQRLLFDIPDDVAFLNCAYMSPLPKASAAAGERGLARKLRPWMMTPDDFFSASEAVRAGFANLINAAPDDIAFAPAVSYGMAQAAANIPLKRTQTIVTLAEQFPSNVYPWMDLAERTGAQFIAVPRPPDDDWTAALLGAIDAATGVVAVPHCHWTDGGLIDLEAVGAACRRVGAVLCVDGTQSVGALPFDVKRLDPDYLAVASYKWLLGPYSFGFLYVAPRRQALPPCPAESRPSSFRFARPVAQAALTVGPVVGLDLPRRQGARRGSVIRSQKSGLAARGTSAVFPEYHCMFSAQTISGKPSGSST